MKRLFPLSIIIIAIAALAGCGHTSGRLEPFGWTPLEADFDSLTIRIDRFYEARGPRDSMRMTIEELMQLARKYPDNKQLQARSTFWEGLLTLSQLDYDEGYALMERALAMTDSARYPYDWHRIAWTLDMDYHEPSLERYNHLMSELNFFLEHHDPMVAGGLAIELGCFLSDLGDTERGITYLRLADSLFSSQGWQDQVNNNRINYAQAICNMRDSAGALELDYKILADTVNPVAPYARDILLGNIYAFSGDTAALREAYLLALGDQLDIEAQSQYQTFWVEEKLKAGELDSARYYMDLATATFPAVERPELKLEYYRMRAVMFERDGRIDSAYHYFKQAAALADSIDSSDKDIQIRNALISWEIAEAQLQDDLERRKLAITQLCITFGLFILLIVGAILYYRNTQRRKLEGMKADLELERSNRRMLAMELVLTEKETLVESISEETRRLREAGEISSAGSNRLISTLKTYVASSVERETFMDTFDKIDAAFAERLRADYPALTDTDLRLAAYVALGLDNKHIARVAGIRPESVKQARWRLRTKLGLPGGASLENAVRPYLNQ